MTEIHLLQQRPHGAQRSTAALAGKGSYESPGARGTSECGVHGWCTSVPRRVSCERCRNTNAFREMDLIYEGPECGDPDCQECPGVALVAHGHSGPLRHALGEDLAIEVVVDQNSLVRRVTGVFESDDNYLNQWELVTEVFERITPDLLEHVADDGYIPRWVYEWFNRKHVESDPP